MEGNIFLHPRNLIWWFPKIGLPQNGWFIIENPIKVDDLGVPLFLETPISKKWWFWKRSLLSKNAFKYQGGVFPFRQTEAVKKPFPVFRLVIRRVVWTPNEKGEIIL